MLDLPGVAEVERAVAEFAPTGDVLELACGPGTWTPLLLRSAGTVTAVDAAPEMLSLARDRVAGDLDRVRFLRDDLFSWRPDRRYDAVFFGFWLSHVPRERFAGFWSMVEECLAPGGRVLFVDDAYRPADELVNGRRFVGHLPPVAGRQRAPGGEGALHRRGARGPAQRTRMGHPRALHRRAVLLGRGH